MSKKRGFSIGSIDQAWPLTAGHTVCMADEHVFRVTNTNTSDTYTCAEADYGKLHKITCVGGTFLFKGGTGSPTISSQSGTAIAPGGVEFVRFSAEWNKLAIAEATGAAFSSTVFLNICKVEP